MLRRPARKVRRVDDAIRRLVDDMIESMQAARGVGLAAPQIGVSLRVVVFGMPEEEPFAIVNPVVVRRSGQRRLESEGCLSVPGYRGEITRSERVTVKGLNLDGREFRIKAEDNLLAQALEHEIDHVNGFLYVDRLDSMDDLIKLDGTSRDAARGSADDADPDDGADGADRADPDDRADGADPDDRDQPTDRGDVTEGAEAE